MDAKWGEILKRSTDHPVKIVASSDIIRDYNRRIKMAIVPKSLANANAISGNAKRYHKIRQIMGCAQNCHIWVCAIHFQIFKNIQGIH